MTDQRFEARPAVVVVAGIAAMLGGCVGLTDGQESVAESVSDPYGLIDMLDYDVANEIIVSLDTWEVDTEFSAAQLSDLTDGTVTEEEYRASFERYRSCLRAAGYELVNIHQNGPFLSAGVPDAAVTTGVDDECYFREYFGVMVVWGNLHMDEAEWESRIHKCVGDNGLDTSTESGHPMPLAAMEQLLIDAGIDPETDC